MSRSRPSTQDFSRFLDLESRSRVLCFEKRDFFTPNMEMFGGKLIRKMYCWQMSVHTYLFIKNIVNIL